MSEEISYTCPKCGRTSYNPNDVANKYCGSCHEFEEDVGRGELELVYGDLKSAHAEIAWLKDALERSVKLQSHYAHILNMYDEGKRMEFASAKEWIDRLQVVDSKREASENE